MTPRWEPHVAAFFSPAPPTLCSGHIVCSSPLFLLFIASVHPRCHSVSCLPESDLFLFSRWCKLHLFNESSLGSHPITPSFALALYSTSYLYLYLYHFISPKLLHAVLPLPDYQFPIVRGHVLTIFLPSVASLWLSQSVLLEVTAVSSSFIHQFPNTHTRMYQPYRVGECRADLP